MISTRFVDVQATPAARATTLAVHVAGRGPLAVLLHGYPLDHRMWLDALHGPLAARRTLAAIDLRGHGASRGTGDPVLGMELLADDVAAVIRALGDGPADVAGLSMGGYVAQAVWARHPGLVRSLVLTNTRAVADSAEARASRDASITTLLEKGRGAIADAMLPRLLTKGADAALTARVRTMIESLPLETFVAVLRGLKERPDRTTLLPGIRVPTLVIGGTEDPIAPRAETEAMAAAIPGARLTIVPGTAHLTPLEQPATFAAAVGELWRP